MSANWKVGDLAKRTSASALSEMPLGHVGEVTSVDLTDVHQPICVDYRYWPFTVDIERVPELPSWARDNGNGTFNCECTACGRDCEVDYMTRIEIIECGKHYLFLGGCSERCIP